MISTLVRFDVTRFGVRVKRFADDHSLRQQIFNRFIKFDQPDVAHHLRPKPRVKQVHHGVINAADVLVNRQPVSRDFRVKRHFGVVRIGVAKVIPRRINERVHRVGFAFRGFAARFGQFVFTNSGTRARGDSPVPVNGAVSGKRTGRFSYCSGTAPQLVAVNNRNRCAPKSLPEIPQSRRRYVVAASPKLFASANSPFPFSHRRSFCPTTRQN